VRRFGGRETRGATVPATPARIDRPNSPRTRPPRAEAPPARTTRPDAREPRCRRWDLGLTARTAVAAQESGRAAAAAREQCLTSLAAPIVFNGRLNYVGRVRRAHPAKNIAEVHDYYDVGYRTVVWSLSRRRRTQGQVSNAQTPSTRATAVIRYHGHGPSTSSSEAVVGLPLRNP